MALRLRHYWRYLFCFLERESPGASACCSLPHAQRLHRHCVLSSAYLNVPAAWSLVKSWFVHAVHHYRSPKNCVALFCSVPLSQHAAASHPVNDASDNAAPCPLASDQFARTNML